MQSKANECVKTEVLTEEQEKELQEIFRVYDSNNNGLIDRKVTHLPVPFQPNYFVHTWRISSAIVHKLLLLRMDQLLCLTAQG